MAPCTAVQKPVLMTCAPMLKLNLALMQQGVRQKGIFPCCDARECPVGVPCKHTLDV